MNPEFESVIAACAGWDRCSLCPSISVRLKNCRIWLNNSTRSLAHIYGLVNNAASGTDGTLAMMHTSQIENLIRLNTLSPIVLTKYVVRRMMADGGGRIVNVASITAFTGYSGLSVYCRDQVVDDRIYPISCARSRPCWA